MAYVATILRDKKETIFRGNETETEGFEGEKDNGQFRGKKGKTCSQKI